MLPTQKIQNIHCIIVKGLEEVNTINNSGELNWKLCYGGSKHNVMVIFSFCFVIGDTEIYVISVVILAHAWEYHVYMPTLQLPHR